MRLSRLLDVIIAILVLSPFFLVEVTTAEDIIESRVDANIDIEFETATDLIINAIMDVSEIRAFETTYYSSDIQNLATSTKREDMITMGGIMQTLHNLLKSQMELSFENANVVPLNTRPTYENSVFYEDYAVNLTSAFFGMNETVNAYDFINGVLDINATVSYTFNLQAEAGWNNTFKYILSDKMSLNYTNTVDVNQYNNEITWTLKNWNGQNPEKQAELSIYFTNPTTSQSNIGDISLEFELDTKNVKNPSLKTNILAKNIDIRDYNILPDSITNLDFVPADGIRLFIDNKLISWDTFYQNTIKTVEESTISAIENSSFNQTLDMVFNWEPATTINCSMPYNVTNMDNTPSIKAILTDTSINLQICSVSSRALFGLVNAGAMANISADDINFGDKLDEIGYQYTGYLYLPDNISLAEENIYDWNQSKPILGEFESDDTPEYSNEEIETLVEIEVSSTDLNLLSFFTGQTELTLGVFLQEKRNYNVTTIPSEFSLPKKVSLKYLNSDAFRLCVEENVFSAKNVTDFLTSEKDLFESRIINIFNVPELNVDGRFNRDVFDESLVWDGNIADMDADTPVKVVSYAHSSYPVSFGLSFIPPKFEISNQSFNFKGVQNQSIVYRMIFPHGTKDVIVNDDLDRAVVGKTDDGRYYMEISFNASESDLTDIVSCKIVPSALFVIGIFMPCIASFIITVILIIVIYIIRKKRKTGRRATVVSDEDKGFEEGYDDQDYYVPPPPPSSK